MSEPDQVPTVVMARGHTRERPPATGWRRLLSVNALGVAILVVALGWSATRVLAIRSQIFDPSVRMVRVAHWQLEAGFREALQIIIDDYNRMHAHDKVRIVQSPVTEKVFAQWLNVNLLSDNPPDIAALGGGVRMTNTPELIARYFRPLSREIVKPNPYNAPEYLDELEAGGEDVAHFLSTAPWRDTMVDGMRKGFVANLQDYYGVSTTMFTTRMMCNLRLLKEATGRDEVPTSLDEFLEACKASRAWARAQNRRFDPIACVSYHLDSIYRHFNGLFTPSFQNEIDLDLDGTISGSETWFAFLDGTLRLDDPRMRAVHEATSEFCQQFNRNFAAMDRDQALAMFVNERAMFMMVPGWDSNSVLSSAKFPIATIPLPVPAPGGRWSEFGTIPANEAGTSGEVNFGITRASKHPDVALDFLRFLSSQRNNQRFNRAVGWMPVTVGSKPSDSMAPYMPNPYGMGASLTFDSGGDLETKFRGKLSQLFGSGEITYDQLIVQIEPLFRDPGIGIDRLWFGAWDGGRSEARNLERSLAVQQARLVFGTGTPETPRSARQVMLSQALLNNGAEVRWRFHQRQGGRPFPPER